MISAITQKILLNKIISILKRCASTFQVIKKREELSESNPATSPTYYKKLLYKNSNNFDIFIVFNNLCFFYLYPTPRYYQMIIYSNSIDNDGDPIHNLKLKKKT